MSMVFTMTKFLKKVQIHDDQEIKDTIMYVVA